MNRGEIWSVAGGVYASKPRPAVIIQDDRFDGTASVTVCPFTSTDLAAPLMRLAVEAGGPGGLEVHSWVMVDKITTVRRSNILSRIGRLSPAQILELEKLVMVFLGLAD